MAARAQGSKLWWSTDSGTTYTQVTEVTSLTTPGASAADISTTDLSDTAHTSLKGLDKYSDYSVALNYDGTNATHQSMQALVGVDTVVDFLIELQEEGAATMTWVKHLGSVSDFTVSASVDDKQTASLTIRPTAVAVVTHANAAQT